MIENNYVTITQLAQQINRSRKTVWHWIKVGRLKSVRVGSEHRIYPGDWQASLAAFNAPRKPTSLAEAN